jgi:PAS domain S-box-containing protein
VAEREEALGLESSSWVGLWQQAVACAADGIFVLNSRGEYLAVNPAYCKLVDKPEAALLGASYYEDLSEESVSLARRTMEMVARNGQSQRTTVMFRRADGQTRTAECHHAVLRANGQAWATVNLARDITQEVVLEHKLWDAAEEHRAAVDFALRTSLGLIRGYVYTLYQHPGIDEARRGRYVQIIEEEVDRLSKFAEDLLDYRRLEVGDLYGSNEVVDVIGVLRSVVSGFAGEAAHRQIEVETNYGKVQSPFFASQDSLRRIFVNLLQNAILYTPAGGKVRVTLEDLEDTLQVKVEDNGPGIPADELPRIFEKFYRGRAAEKVKGTGLGLAIAKTLTESLGGALEVESYPERGTTFCLRLPRKGYVVRDWKVKSEQTEYRPVSIAMEN